MTKQKPKATFEVRLPGGQERLRQLILYVAHECRDAVRFGGIKLNKILWKSDFDSYASRRVPVTGRRYQREKFGPVPHEMLPLHRDMLNRGQIRVDQVYFGDDVVENRTIPLVLHNLALFTPVDLQFVDDSIRYHWNLTGMETSDDSHGVAWRTRADGEPLPYEAAFLSDKPLSRPQLQRLAQRAYSEGWTSE
jgi:hypothetical protein